ncbi:hypothetical protein PV326_009639 [Microctonus aethiopoides]|nr:hypothetical protein PV326_009639 [Microctonus aethiopoides]
MILIRCFELPTTESNNQLKTVFLSVVFRHGDRAPDFEDGESYATDPHKNDTFFPAGSGGLTNEGKKREYELGAKLRSEYQNFFGDIYKPQMPIPIKYFPAENDTLMAADLCPQYKEELKRVENSSSIQREYKVFDEFKENLRNWTGNKIETARDMFNIYHTLMAESSMNRKLPNWTKDIFPNGLLEKATIFDYRLRSYNIKLRKLYGGMLLRNIIDTMYDIIDSRISGRKINLFSGHETNVASFLLTLGVYTPHVPQYSSGVIVELLNNQTDVYYVKIRYYKGIPSEIVDVNIKGCDVICPINKFKRLLKNVIPSDEDMYCPHDKPMRGSENYEIEFLHVLFRHGDRTPAELYPNDPNPIESFYPEGLGQLTVAGKVREYELGMKLRHLYGNYLGKIYKPHEVMARSTNFDRTKMSLMLVLSALYPPKDQQIWNPTLNWQPIPFKYYKKQEDILMAPNISLRKFIDEVERVEGLEEMKTQIKKFHPLMKNLTLWTGTEIDSIEKIFHLYHSLIAEHSMGLELPNWAHSIIHHGDIMWEAAVFHYHMRSYNSKLRRLNGGMLLRNFIDIMTGIANKTINDGRKIQLFSGHENNVAAFLKTLGIFKPHVPEYSSCVILELLRDKYRQYYVGVRHFSIIFILNYEACI